MSATCGTGVGVAEGVCMPGIMWCGLAEGVDDGDAAGICIPGFISCRGVGDGEGEAVVVGLRVVGRRVFARVRRFGAAFGLGLAAAGFFGITCPSC